jgi:hypothetical protein
LRLPTTTTTPQAQEHCTRRALTRRIENLIQE